jgi:DNA-binding HxlR family transcriptional regulator
MGTSPKLIPKGDTVMSGAPYGIVCPITHACNILEPRWTIPILSEMWGGSTRFNEIRRGVGNLSTALLSKRLKDLEAHGMIERIEDPATGQVDYVRTQRAIELEPALDALAKWAQCNIKARNALLRTDVPTLMWQMRGLVFSDELPKRQIVMQFRFSDPGLAYDTYWLLTRPGCPTEICTEIPGFEIDLFIETDRISLASILLSRTTIEREKEKGRLFVSGDALLDRTMGNWLYRRTKEDPNEVLQLEDAER